MLHQCDKCGATTRWYDEKCPSCGVARAIEIPTSPIALPRFAPSSKPSAETVAAAPPALTPRPETTPGEETSEAQKTTTPLTEEAEASQETTTGEPGEETSEAQETTTPTTEEAQENQETPLPPEPSERFAAFLRAVDVWRSALSTETASVTVPRGRVVRYALGIVGELFVCPPCAFLAAYFFTRALFADRRAQYHAAMVETEKARRTLAVGLGVFAATLCAFIFYVQSQEIAVPSSSDSNVNLFKN